ncbi:MAG: hypothetical protein Ta2D_13390 [Rickettsiales bacterium]|nr:MAG: hypothetical protein Ta2D_13390 [Rickettsiales bacterium]
MKNIKEIEELKEYFNGVVARANHHAFNVANIIYSLLGFIILKGENIKIREYNGHAANLLSCLINEKEYTFRYEHSGDFIEIKNGSNIVFKIDNATTIDSLQTMFGKL